MTTKPNADLTEVDEAQNDPDTVGDAKKEKAPRMEVHISVHTDDRGLFSMFSKSEHASDWPKEVGMLVASKMESPNMGRLMMSLIEEGRVQISLSKIVCGDQVFIHNPITPIRKK